MRGYQSVKVNRLETNTTNTIKLNSIHCNIKLKSRLAEKHKRILNHFKFLPFCFPFPCWDSGRDWWNNLYKIDIKWNYQYLKIVLYPSFNKFLTRRPNKFKAVFNIVLCGPSFVWRKCQFPSDFLPTFNLKYIFSYESSSRNVNVRLSVCQHIF